MTTAYLGILITALAIEIDKITRFQHRSLPIIALLGLLTLVAAIWV